VALTELEALKGRREHIERLDNDAALLEYCAGMVPEALHGLAPKERRSIPWMLRLKVVACPDGQAEVTGVFGGPLEAGPSRSIETGIIWSQCLPTKPVPLVLIFRNA
jgi:hypothetical protein